VKSLRIDYLATYLTIVIFSFQMLPTMKTVTVTLSYKRCRLKDEMVAFLSSCKNTVKFMHLRQTQFMGLNKLDIFRQLKKDIKIAVGQRGSQ
jgi:glutaredoxin-related protein